MIRQLGGSVVETSGGSVASASKDSPLNQYLVRLSGPAKAAVQVLPLEQRVHSFFSSLQIPAAITFAVLGGGYGLLSTGLGAGIFGALLAGVTCLFLLSSTAINYFIKLFYLVAAFLIFVFLLAIIGKFWSLGHTASTTAPAAATEVRANVPIAGKNGHGSRREVPSPSDTGRKSQPATHGGMSE